MAYIAVRRKRRLANPGRRRRKMSAKQIAIFGTKRQKAALKAGRRRRRNPGGMKRLMKRFAKGKSSSAQYRYKLASHKKRATSRISRFIARNPRRKKRSRKRNVGSILVASIPGINPGRKRRKKSNMARRRRRGRRHNPGMRRRRRVYRARRRRNPGRVRTRTVIKYRTRGRRHRSSRRHRNPGVSGFGADLGAAAGVIAGATVNSLAMGFVPASFAVGVPGYIASAVIAVLQGQLVGKMLKKPGFGRQMTIGGLTYTAIKVINDFMPSLTLGLHGLGAIAPSAGFFTPQVNKWGSMGAFQAPGTLMNAIALAGAGKGVKGLGDPNFSARRVGRIQ